MRGHVGFTGTQRWLSGRQVIEVQRVLIDLRARGYKHFHHGDCVGADAEASKIARGLGYMIVCHPPENPEKRAWTAHHELRAPAPYLVRNREIVRQVNVLIAAPGEARERVRSGTWSTVRYARKVGLPVYLIPPAGEVTGSLRRQKRGVSAC